MALHSKQKLPDFHEYSTFTIPRVRPLLSVYVHKHINVQRSELFSILVEQEIKVFQYHSTVICKATYIMIYISLQFLICSWVMQSSPQRREKGQKFRCFQELQYLEKAQHLQSKKKENLSCPQKRSMLGSQEKDRFRYYTDLIVPQTQHLSF